MRSVIAATTILITCMAAANAQTRNEPACSADQTGTLIVTRIRYQDGYRVEAPWRITSEGKFSKGGSRITAVLDHIIETDPFTAKRKVTSLPSAVEMTFKGADRRALLREAADVWCATVGKAMADRPTHSSNRVAQNRTIM